MAEHLPCSTHRIRRPELIATLLANRAEQQSFRGWDPFDGLNSNMLNCLPFRRQALLRLAWLQLFKRSPVNLRLLAGVPRVRNAKATSLCLRTFLLLDRESGARRLLDMLLEDRCAPGTWGDGAWGYPFDWQARAFAVPRGTPNLICTAFALRAIVAAGREGLLSSDRTAELAWAAASFVERELARERNDGSLIIRYVPQSDAVVLNVGAWGAYVLAEGASLCGEARWREMSLRAAETVLGNQAPEGYWIYGERQHHRFVDGFHIGYILEALACIERRLGCRFDQAIARGLSDYRRSFFGPDGRPYYYRDQPFPIDCHAAAQGILTLVLVGDEPDWMEQAATIVDWTTRHMWNRAGERFHYQKGRLVTNRIDYFRWTQCWMMLALASFAHPGRARALA